MSILFPLLSIAIDRVENSGPTVTKKEPLPFRIAVVGCGPRGLFCLDCLATLLRRSNPAVKVEIVVYEPAADLGAGNVYATSQPDFLRMNFAAKHIDAWLPALQRPAAEVSFVDYLAKEAYSYGPESFVPRGVVGLYLRECADVVFQRLAATAKLSVLRERVSQIDVGRDGHCVRTSQSARPFNEVLITIGHEAWRGPDMLTRTAEQFVPSVFPTNRQLCTARVPVDSVVAVRGFGLTCIDAVLALTEGRGGRFISDSSGWRYIASGKEPRCILPFSRTGRPMLAKPIGNLMDLPPGLNSLWKDGRSRIQSITRPIQGNDFACHLMATVQRTASNALRHVQKHHNFQHCHRFAEDHSKGIVDWTDAFFQTSDVYHILTRSADVAEGIVRPDYAWALGESWRRLYPAIVDRVSHGGLAHEVWPQFEQNSVEMERIAFGPPAENVRRILALANTGILNLQFVTGRLRTSQPLSIQTRRGDQCIQTDVLVNAVLPRPIDFDRQGPLYHLLKQGVIRQLHGHLGIEVDEAGTPISTSGKKLLGISILGRPTEGCILGNDTLSRVLHQQPVNWAEQVATRIAAAAERV